MAVMRLLSTGFVLASWCLVGCAGLPLAPAYPLDDPGFAETAPVEQPGIAGDRAEGLKLFPGDVLTVEIASTQTQTYAGLTIDGVGQIHLPLIGDVTVGGLSLSEAEAVLKAESQRFDRLAQVTVSLTSPAGHRVVVLGAVMSPGAIVLPPGARLGDVIALAGGPRAAVGELGTDWAASRVVRDGQPLPVDMAKAVAGDPLHNVHLRPGDHVYVAYAHNSIVSVFGAVGTARVLPYHAGLRLTEALAASGGIPPAGDKGDVRVIRGPLTAPHVYTTSVRDIVSGSSHDVTLRAGDVVYVTEHWLEDLGEVVALITPFITIGLSAVSLYITLELLNRTLPSEMAPAAEPLLR